MVCRYIDDGKLYVASVCGVDIAVFLVTDHSPETVEIKNIAVIPSRQGWDTDASSFTGYTTGMEDAR